MQRLTGFDRRKQRVRFSLRKNAAGRVRLSVFRSGRHIYAQLIDDARGETLAAASTLDKELRTKKTAGVEAAKAVGGLIAERAKAAKVGAVVFDRGGYIFHGRVKALAEGARAGGLDF